MPELRIFRESVETPVIHLTLMYTPSGVTLVMVDASGDKIKAPGIVTITKEGRLYLHRGVNTEVGLELDSYGAIELTNTA